MRVLGPARHSSETTASLNRPSPGTTSRLNQPAESGSGDARERSELSAVRGCATLIDPPIQDAIRNQLFLSFFTFFVLLALCA